MVGNLAKKSVFRSSSLRIFLLVLGLLFNALTVAFSLLDLPKNVYVMCGVVGLTLIILSTLLFGRETLWSLNAGAQRMQKRMAQLEATIRAEDIDVSELAASLSEQTKIQELVKNKNNPIILDQLNKLDGLKSELDEVKKEVKDLENVPAQMQRLDAAITLCELNANVPPGTMDALRWIKNHHPHGRVLWLGSSVANVERLAEVEGLSVDFRSHDRSKGMPVYDIAKFDCVFLDLTQISKDINSVLPLSWVSPSANVFVLGVELERIQQLNFGTPVEVAKGKADGRLTEISIRRNLK